jgi:hypothetical protein
MYTFESPDITRVEIKMEQFHEESARRRLVKLATQGQPSVFRRLVQRVTRSLATTGQVGERERSRPVQRNA